MSEENLEFARRAFGAFNTDGIEAVLSVMSNQSFILPSAYRPTATHEFVVAYGQSNTCTGTPCDYRHAVVQVRDVIALDAQPGAGDHFSEGVSLDGVEFRSK
jgi:hypothetical protein